MNLQLLKKQLAAYQSHLQQHPIKASKGLFKWETLKHFQDNWDVDAPDFAAMYDACLQNSSTKRIWRRENYDAKSMMLKFIALQPDFVRYMFKDLFREQNDIVGRVDRFVFHCDELLKEYKDKNPRSVENNHFHDDGYGMVSWYLSLRFPEAYAPHNFEAFRLLLQQLRVRDVPQSSDFGRFCKVARTLYKMMEKEEGLLEMHSQRLDANAHYLGKSLLIVEDFYLFSTGIEF